MSETEAKTLAEADAQPTTGVHRQRPSLPRQRGAAARQVQSYTPAETLPTTEHKPHPKSIAETATLVHGFTMDDVNRAAQIASRKLSYRLADEEEREQAAWHGVVEYLYECGCGWGSCNRTQAVTFYDLLFAGMDAVSEAAAAALHHHGRTKDGTKSEGPNFAKYWLPPRHSKHFDDDGFSEHLCEKLALRDVLSTLTPGQYRVVSTLAAFDNDYAKAADALGMHPQTFRQNLMNARRRIAVVWFEHETPPQKAPRNQGTCSRGHAYAEHGYLAKDGRQMCRRCLTLAARRYRARNQNGIREHNREYARKARQHKRGDHSECLPEKCPDAPTDAGSEQPD